MTRVPVATPVDGDPSGVPVPALVDVRRWVPGIQVELKYATNRNVTKQVLYPPNMPCLLHPKTAEKLLAAQMFLQARGYGLKVWDAWRPPEVQLSLFDHGGYTGMFTDPRIMWSRHCSGTAVDVTLVDDRGKELRMPTGFDTGGRAAHYVYTGDDKKVREHMRLLQIAMTNAGFSILDNEWWHFDDAEYNARAVPPVVFTSEVGVELPLVRGKKRSQ